MIVDYLRSCYTVDMRFYPSDLSTTTPVRWFFAKPGAKQLPYYHHFASRQWADREYGSNQLGEVIGGARPYYRGTALSARPGTKTNTPASRWVDGCAHPAPQDEDCLCGDVECAVGGLSGEGLFAFPVGLPGWPYFPYPPVTSPPIVVPVAGNHLCGCGSGSVIRRAIRGSGILGGGGNGSLDLTSVTFHAELGGSGHGLFTLPDIHGSGGPLGGSGAGELSRRHIGAPGAYLGGSGEGEFASRHLGAPGAYLGGSGEGDIVLSLHGTPGELGGSGEGDIGVSIIVASPGELGGSGDVWLALSFDGSGMVGSGPGTVAAAFAQVEQFAMAGTGTAGTVAAAFAQVEQFAMAGTGTAGTVAAVYTDVSSAVDSFAMAGTGTAGTVAAVYREFPVTSGCSQFASVATRWAFTMPTLTNGTCLNCSSYAGAQQVNYVSGCIWGSAGVAQCGISGTAKAYQLSYNSGPGLMVLIAENKAATAMATYSLAVGSFNPVGSNVLTRTSTTGLCTGWPSSITIDPV